VTTRFAVIGASGFGREVMPLLRTVAVPLSSAGSTICFVDDKPPSARLNGQAVVTFQEWIEQEASERLAVIAIADSAVREKMAIRCEQHGVKFLELRANNVVVMDDVFFGPGAVLCPFVTVTSNVRVGRHFHANIYSYVAHDCVIGDFVTLAPAVKCNGNVVIEDHAYIGTGAVLRQGRPGEPLVIGRGAVVGMGAVVTRSVPAGATVVGNPARPLEAPPG